jgi:hypothetical protein
MNLWQTLEAEGVLRKLSRRGWYRDFNSDAAKDTPNSGQRYTSSQRRLRRGMCADCVKAKHENCESYTCPCICNDEAWAAQQSMSRLTA